MKNAVWLIAMSPSELPRFLAFCARACDDVTLLQRRNVLLDFESPVPAAVLVGFAPDSAGRWQILLTRRATTLRKHGGQIAFAGGRSDHNDANAVATALREAAEEVGTPPVLWRIAGKLPECRTPSGFSVTPVLAYADALPVLRPNPDEVAETFWLPIETALNPQLYRARAFDWQGQRYHSPALVFGKYDIWGVTALILRHLAACAAEWRQQNH